MLVIRLQRTGRAGKPMYRLVVQDSKTHPSKGRVVSFVGQYNPHTKELNINKADIEKFLRNGAQPSDRVVKILTKEGVKMPKWVKLPSTSKQDETRNKDKWRRFAEKEEEAPAEEAVAETPAEAPVEAPETPEAPAEETK